MRHERTPIKRIPLFIPLAVALGLAAAVMCAAFALQNSSEHKVLFEKAKFTMETKGDLKGAIELFEEIIKKYPNERDYAAKSLYLVGICYEKLGERQAQQAQAAFQRVIQDYPDQTEEVNLAKEKLLVFQRAQAPAATGEGTFRIREFLKVGSFASFSPDGKHVSFRDDSGNLAIIDIATGKKRLLTDSASWGKGDFVSTSTISPDDKRVAYAWCENFADLTLKIVNLDSSGVRVLHSGRMEPRDNAEYFWPVAWTSDGRQLLGYLDRARTRRICFMDVTDESLKFVGPIQKAGLIPTESMRLSPDDRWIACDRLQGETSGKYDIILVKADGSGEAPLITHPASDRLLGWTPGDDSVLFASDRSGSWDAWIVPVRNGKTHGEPILVKRDFGQVGGTTGIVPLGFTNDGSYYYTVHALTEEVLTATLDLEKGELIAPPQKVAQRFEGTNCYADWSPDGRYLAFSSSRGPNSSALCLVSVDTGEQRDIFPPGAGTFIRVNWHPDGKSVVVVGTKSGGIHRIDIESEKTSPVVTEGRGFHSPRCTPDGRFVFYEDDSFQDNIYRIMRVDLETKEKKEFYRSTQQIIRLDISRDGKSLAFLEPADWALKVMALEGRQPRAVYRFRENEWATSVTWSPDGKYLLFSKVPLGEDKRGKIELWRISSDGGEPVKLPLEARGMETLRIHPDGKRISFNTFAVSQETYVMENFLPKSKGEK